MFGTSRRRSGPGGTNDQAWERWTAAISAADGSPRSNRRSRRRRIVTRTLLGVGIIAAVTAARRANRRRSQQCESTSSRRIEFVDVDRPPVRGR